ncbi:MAG: hypothetical protein GC153_10030 [Alphaproteobacteria bacterium]|nr:hypothetical protein [Alphaproteobacteria bacterium]
MLEPDQNRRRNQRNLAIGLAIGAFILLIYLVTLLRVAGNIHAHATG